MLAVSLVIVILEGLLGLDVIK